MQTNHGLHVDPPRCHHPILSIGNDLKCALRRLLPQLFGRQKQSSWRIFPRLRHSRQTFPRLRHSRQTTHHPQRSTARSRFFIFSITLALRIFDGAFSVIGRLISALVASDNVSFSLALAFLDPSAMLAFKASTHSLSSFFVASVASSTKSRIQSKKYCIR